MAGRIPAPAIGVSLYTWTSIIGVVLGGLALGNYLGGLIADRRPKRSTLSTLYLLCALTSALILVFANDVESVAAPTDWPAVLQVLWLSVLMFFVPSILLGTVTPVIVKLTLRSLATTGNVVGRIQAAATLGSIVGTFATGFFLISWFGTRSIVAGVAAALFALSILSNPVWTTLRTVAAIGVAVVLVGLAVRSEDPCLRESNYYCIELDQVQPGVVALKLDYLVHSYVDVFNPARLIYPYEHLYDRVIRAAYPQGTTVDALALGGGGYTFPRYITTNYPGRVFVAEIDPEVTQVARDYLRLQDSPRIEIDHQDARLALREDLAPDERFDIAHGDVFNDLSVPYHLTTHEFNDLLARHMKPDGLYIVNVVDGVKFEFLRSYLRTLKLTFDHVRLMALPGTWPVTGLRSTYVVVASQVPPPEERGMIPEDELEQFLRSGESTILKDDHVPVDQLLAPVFRQRLELQR